MKIIRVILLVSGIALIAIVASSKEGTLPDWLAYLGFIFMISSAALNWVPNTDRKREEDHFISEMQRLIEGLQSEDPDQRFEACEQLRKLPSISPNALDALKLTAQDKNSDVANIAQKTMLEYQIKKLESYKIRLENSVPNSTTIMIAIVAFIIFFTCVIGVAGISAFIGPSLDEQIEERPILMFYYIIIAVVFTIPTVMYFQRDSKQKDVDSLEFTNNEIQELKDKLQEIKLEKPV